MEVNGWPATAGLGGKQPPIFKAKQTGGGRRYTGAEPGRQMEPWFEGVVQ